MGHSHGTEVHIEVGQRARVVLTAFLALLGVLAIAGMIWLWPAPSQVEGAIHKIADAPGVSYDNGTIVSISEGCASASHSGAKGPQCQTAKVKLTSGQDAGKTVDVELSGPQTHAGLRPGDSLETARIPTEQGPIHAFSGVNRLPVIATMLALFAVAVVVVARWRGLMALVALGIAAYVLLGYMLPAVIVGKPGVLVALSGSTVIMFIVLYVAHGVSIRTSAALAGTLLGLAVTTGLGALAVHAARLSGFADENEYDLAQLAPAINFQDLLMVAIIVGGLGVLNDVTITQASAAWELRAAAPHWSRRQIFTSGMRIGRDHIASTIYTIVFAYAGAALSVLLLLYFSTRKPLSLLGVEMFAGEAVRTLGSAIGLILSVPITTGIAALTVGPARDAEPQAGVHAGDHVGDHAGLHPELRADQA